jgi:hypothetical protein
MKDDEIKTTLRFIRGMRPARFANHGVRKVQITVGAPPSSLRREPNVR